jgi:cell wall-associated NlpC family hydrolase
MTVAVHQLAERDVAPIDRRRAPQRSKVHPSTIRRRRVVLAIGAVAATAWLAAMGSGTGAAWWALGAVIGVGALYLTLLHWTRRKAAEREFTTLLGSHSGEVGVLADPLLRLQPERDADVGAVASPSATVRGARYLWALARFCVACSAGWALSPLVFALTLVARETPRDATSQRWLANLEHAQKRLREQSLRTIAVSAAATASVTAVGSVAMLGGAGVATAAPVVASASVASGIGAVSAFPTLAPPGPTYTVLDGDTLWSIAARFGTSVAELASSNHVADPNLILPGQVLAIAGATRGVGAATAGRGTYVVQPGDTLSSLAARFATTVSVLAATNNIADANLIYAGQTLVVHTWGPATAGMAASLPPTRAAGDPDDGPVAPAPPRANSPDPTTPHGAPARRTVARRRTETRSRATSTARPATRHQSVSRPAPAPARPSAAQTAVRVALEQVGKPYQWGGAGPYAFDCSGLVMYAWAQAGVDLPHYTVSQYEDTTRITESELQPGDLVFYDTGDGAQPGHVTMYIGNGQVVTADTTGTDIRVESLTWDGTPMGFGRVG